MRLLFCIVTFLFFFIVENDCQIIKLYPDDVSNSKTLALNNKENIEAGGFVKVVNTPTLEVFLPKKENATGAGVVICPGGGYSVIVYREEGVQTAKEFAQRGIAAFVLKYRLPLDDKMMDKTIGPLQDAQQAIKLVCENAQKWNVDRDRISIMGFSAGGHLVLTATTHYQKSLIENKYSINLRPDFQILVYPVISMQDQLTHLGSRNQLLGSNPSRVLKELYSNALHVDKDTPPTYLTHAADDKTVDVGNSIAYFKQLRLNNVPVEMHIYPKGDHGFIFRHPGWMEPLFKWMQDSGFQTKN